MKLVLFLFLMLSRAALPAAHAQTFLTWEDCVREASQNNPDFMAVQQEVRRGRYEVKASRSDFFPELSLESSYNAGNVSSSIGTLGVEFNTRQEIEGGVGLSQNLFNGLKDRAGYRRSRAQLGQFEAGLSRTVAEISLELRNTFTNLLYAQKLLDLTEMIRKRRSQNLRLVRLRFEGGIENKGSLLRSEAQEQQSEFEIAEARRDLQSTQTQLATLLGRPEPSTQNLRAQGLFRVGTLATHPDFEALARQTPDYQELAARLKVTEQEVALAKGDLYPSVDASASVFRSKIVERNTTTNWSAGVVLSYPLLLGGRDVYEVKSAKAARKRSEEELRSLELQLIVQLKESYLQLKNAIERVAVQESFLKAARVRSEIATAQYANGLTSFFDWDSIENDLIQTEQSYLLVLRDALLAEAQWERAQGQGAW